ncbi:MAG TPA: ABC transporter permease [Thermoanaerobaculaceae bacterium]|nr:ABC transporter permease [Thermoanaerobaculaceae bacterium]
MWHSFYAVFRKEFLHIFRDKGTLRLVLMIPAMQLILFGFIDQTVHDVPTVVADQDRTSDSRLLVDELRATGTFKIVTVTTSPDEVRQEIRSARARVGVVIPPNFHDRKLHKDNAQVLVLIDGSDSTLSTQALASVNGLIAEDNARLEPVRTALAAQPIILFNPEGRTANYLIPGLVAVVLMMLGVVLSSSAIVREREKGTFEQLLVTPIHPIGLVLGKLFPYLIFGLVEGAIVLAIMRFGFQVPIRGSLLLLFAAAVVYLLALLPVGLLISSRASTQLESQQLAQAFFLPAIFLSGYVFAFEGLPWALRVIGYVFPTTHMIAIMRGIVLRDASLLDLWPHVCALMATSAVAVFLASRSIRKVAL